MIKGSCCVLFVVLPQLNNFDDLERKINSQFLAPYTCVHKKDKTKSRSRKRLTLQGNPADRQSASASVESDRGSQTHLHANTETPADMYIHREMLSHKQTREKHERKKKTHKTKLHEKTSKESAETRLLHKHWNSSMWDLFLPI